MLYKFKSRATADVIMLQANGRQLVHLMGKDPDAAHGILTLEQIPAAIAALEQAIAAEDQARVQARHAAQEGKHAANAGDSESESECPPAVHLHQRAAPLLDMLRRSHHAEREVTW